MSRSGLVAASVLLGVVVAFASTSVGAQSSREEALRHFREGQKHFNLSEFEEALKEFKESYRLRDDPTLLFNIGQCQWKLGDLRTAIHSYRAYLRMGKDVPNRAEVQARIQDLEARLPTEEANGATTTAVAPAPMPPAEMTAPSATADAPEAISHAPQVGVGKASAEPQAETGPVRSGAESVVPTAAPLPKSTEEPIISRSEVSPRTEARPIYSKWWFWTTVGAVLAGGVLTALMLGSSSPSEPACPAGVRCP